MKFIHPLGLTFVAICLLNLGINAHAQHDAPPNIILIMADDLGYGHLGAYGQQHIKTPHIDQLAQEGMLFTSAYAGSSLCAPSRSVLMTGYHVGHTPVRGNSGGIALRNSDITFAEVLQDAGYTTGLFGKWGLGDAGTTGVPNKQGFDEFFGYLHQKHAHFYYTDYLWHNQERHMIEENRWEAKGVYVHDLILEKSLDFIDNNQSKPFFMFLSMTIPHHEWIAPAEAVAEYSGKLGDTAPEHKWRQGYALPKEPRATMAGMISHMDRGVGDVMKKLEALGIRDNTLVIFTSDNGADRYSLANPEFFEANGPLREFKGTLYEGGLRIPAIASWPGKIRANTANSHPYYFGDYFATFADLAGATDQVPQGLDSISITPTLLQKDAPQLSHDFFYWELGDGGSMRAGRLGKWKIVQASPGADYELYDLHADVSEETNLATMHPKVVKRMKRLLMKNHEQAMPQTEPHAPDGQQHR